MIQRVQMVLGQTYEITVDLIKNICSTQKDDEIKTFPIFKDNEFKYAERVIHPSDINLYGIDYVEEEIYYAVCFRIREYEYDHLVHKIDWTKKRWWWLPSKTTVADYFAPDEMLFLVNVLLNEIQSQWYGQTYNNNEKVESFIGRHSHFTHFGKDIVNSFRNTKYWTTGVLQQSKTFQFDASVLLLYGVGIIDYNTMSTRRDDDEESVRIREYMEKLSAFRSNKTRRYQRKTAIVTYYSLHTPTLLSTYFGQLMVVTNTDHKTLEKILRQTIFFSPMDQLVIK